MFASTQLSNKSDEVKKKLDQVDVGGLDLGEEIDLGILDIDDMTLSDYCRKSGVYYDMGLSSFVVSRFSEEKGCKGVVFCTARTDQNMALRISPSKGLEWIIDIQNSLKKRYAKADGESEKAKWDNVFLSIENALTRERYRSILKANPNFLTLDLNPENSRTYKVVENFTKTTHVPCLGVVTPGFAWDVCSTKKPSPTRFYDNYTKADDELCERNYNCLCQRYPSVFDEEQMGSVGHKNMFKEMELDAYSKNVQIEKILKRFAVKFSGKKMRVTYADDREVLCKSAAAVMQSVCNKLAKKHGGRITFKVICHSAFDDTVKEIPVVGTAEFYARPAAVLPSAVQATEAAVLAQPVQAVPTQPAVDTGTTVQSTPRFGMGCSLM